MVPTIRSFVTGYYLKTGWWHIDMWEWPHFYLNGVSLCGESQWKPGHSEPREMSILHCEKCEKRMKEALGNVS
jgi:hypothetical protein